MEINIGISPCPNDTFIFEHLCNGQIKIDKIQFRFHFADVQELNKMAQQNALDVVKISFANYINVFQNYKLSHAGSALGFGVGPLLVSKNVKRVADLKSHHRIAIPGKNTTAYFLLKFAFPELHNTHEIIFSEIENKILQEDVDLGCIIHESRFTYQQKGLLALADLGNIWEEKTNLPIPLGAIAINRNLDIDIQKQIEKGIYASLKMQSNHTALSSFIKNYAAEMQEDVMQKHIELYVNNETLWLSENGKLAIEKLLQLSNVKIDKEIFIV